MAKSISHVQGKGSLSHNNRDFVYGNVNPERTKNNITYIRQSLSDTYKSCFGDAVAEYNQKQKRADRRIDDYYKNLFGEAKQANQAVSANGEKSFYETVVQIGNMHDSGVDTSDGCLVAKCLDEYMRGFQARNPAFHVFNAVLHMDEKTPHLHIDYIPVASGYKNGMRTRNSISKALASMGYGTDKESISRWRIAERKILEDICRTHGIEIAPPGLGRGKSLTVEEYKKQAQQGYEQGRESFAHDWAEYIEMAEQTEAQDAARHKEMQDKCSELAAVISEMEAKKADLQKWLNREKNREAAESKAKFDKLPKPNTKAFKYEQDRRGRNTGNVIVPEADLKIMREQAAWYRRGIGLNEREIAVAGREDAVSTRELAAAGAEKAAKAAQEAANKAQAAANALYQQQLVINQMLERKQAELAATKKALQDSRTAEAVLREQITMLTVERDNVTSTLESTKGVLESISEIFKDAGREKSHVDVSRVISAFKLHDKGVARDLERIFVCGFARGFHTQNFDL